MILKYLINRFAAHISLKQKVKHYLCKCFLLNLIKIFGSFFIIVFFLNFIDSLDSNSVKNSSLFVSIAIAALKVPDFLNSISPSLILFASLATFFNLSNKSEITIIRCSGYSLWHLTLPLVTASFLIGLFWITIYNGISIHSYRLATNLQSQIYQKNIRQVIKPKSGIWIKQDNPEYANGYIIVKSKMLYKDNIEMISNSLWFFDDDFQFYKKIDSEKMLLRDGHWEISNGIINGKEILSKKEEKISIKSNIDYDVFQKNFLTILRILGYSQYFPFLSLSTTLRV